MIDLDDLIAEARSRANLCSQDAREAMRDTGDIVTRLADALEAATSERDAERDAQAERVSMEVLDEYLRIAAWLETQAALREATGDTMHGLAAEALATLIDHEYSRHTIPLYGMLDVWMALHGTSHPDFDEFYDEHGYAEAWSRLMAEIRSRAAVPDAATELRAERDAALAAIERVRAEADAYAEQSDVMEPCGAVAQALRTTLDGAPEPEDVWEYAAGYIALDGKPHPFENRGYLRFAAEADREKYGSDEAILVRRRKAGPWEPVGGEN